MRRRVPARRSPQPGWRRCAAQWLATAGSFTQAIDGHANSRTSGMQSDLIDPTNPVVALCAAGMAAEGTPTEARRLFEQAWAARRDDYDAAIAAHFVARHQATAADALHWNALAVRHAEAVADGRASGLLASLYLNRGDAQANVGDVPAAAAAVRRAAEHLAAVPPGGYRQFVALGIRRLAERLGGASPVQPAIRRIVQASGE